MFQSWKRCLTLLFGFCLFYFIIFQLAISTSTPRKHVRTAPVESEAGTSRSFRDGVSQNPLVGDGGPCSRLTNKLDLLVLILTDSYDSLGRNLMRATYGGSLNKYKSLYSMTFFLVDVSNGVIDEQDLIKEMAIFNDISLFVSEFSYSGSESLNFNITLFPKTSTWVKNCVQNSVNVLYFEHLREFQLFHMLEELNKASHSFIPSAIPNNIFIAPSHIISSFVGSKIEDWGVYIPNNLERLLLYLPTDNKKLKDFVYSREDTDTNGTITDFESKFILKWQAINTKKMIEGTLELPVFEKLRIHPKYAQKRPKTTEPKRCLPPIKTGNDYREERSILVFVDWEVGNAWHRNEIRKSYGLVKPFTSGNVQYDFNVRFLVTQHRYVLFKVSTNLILLLLKKNLS